MADTENPIYILKSENGNGPDVTIEKDSVGLSRILSGLESDDPVPSRFSADVLIKVTEYLRKYKDNAPASIERPLPSDSIRDVVSEWDATYIEVEVPFLIQLLLAAHYLDVGPLVDLCGAKIATLIDNKSPEEIRNTFGLEANFSADELERIETEKKCLESD